MELHTGNPSTIYCEFKITIKCFYLVFEHEHLN